MDGFFAGGTKGSCAMFQPPKEVGDAIATYAQRMHREMRRNISELRKKVVLMEQRNKEQEIRIEEMMARNGKQAAQISNLELVNLSKEAEMKKNFQLIEEKTLQLEEQSNKRRPIATEENTAP